MKRPLLLGILSAFAPLLWGGEWPVDASSTLFSHFGKSQGETFTPGIFLEGEGRIRAWDGGEVIWTGDRNPLGEDNLVVLEHQNGFRSFYMGINQVPGLPSQVVQGEILGYPGEAPWLFSISDRLRGRRVNPLSLLPSRSSSEAASLGDSYLRGASGKVLLKEGLVINAGDWEVTADISGSPGKIPYDVALYWLGTLITEIHFDTLAESPQGITLGEADPRLFEESYNGEGQLIIGKVRLAPGRGNLEIRVRNREGQGEMRSWRVEVSALDL